MSAWFSLTPLPSGSCELSTGGSPVESINVGPPSPIHQGGEAPPEMWTGLWKAANHSVWPSLGAPLELLVWDAWWRHVLTRQSSLQEPKPPLRGSQHAPFKGSSSLEEMCPQSKQFLELVTVSWSLRKSLGCSWLISLPRKQRPALHPNKEQGTKDNTWGQRLLSGTLGLPSAWFCCLIKRDPYNSYKGVC